MMCIVYTLYDGIGKKGVKWTIAAYVLNMNSE